MNKKINMNEVLKGTLIAYAITLLLLFIYSVILCYSNVSESTIPTVVFVISMISVFTSSSIRAIKIKENGLKNGGLIGFTYVILIYVLSSLFSSNFRINTYSISTIIFNILLGMLGGIVGVNLVHK